MEKEVLTISRNLIRVEYEFLNMTSNSIKETIFFPMPFYGFDYGCSPEYSGELERFKVWADGVRMTPLRMVRAKLKGVDVTDHLIKLGFSDEDIAEYRGLEGYCGSDDTPPPAGVFAKNLDVLVKDGLMEIFVVNDNNKPRIVDSRALWEAAYFYSWEQIFPPMKKIRIVHEYVPFRGTGVWRYDFRKIESFKNEWTESVDKFCMSDGTIKAGKRIQIENKTEGFEWNSLQYILTTGANWAGPIKDFTLNLKKESKNEVVSLCFDGNFTRSDDLTITSNVKNFLPKKDITTIFFFNSLNNPVTSGEGYEPGYRRTKNKHYEAQ